MSRKEKIKAYLKGLGLSVLFGLPCGSIYFYEKLNEIERKEERKRKKRRTEKRRLWLCPICKTWVPKPETHLKTAHDTSDDMINFWIQKGSWL